MRAAIRHLNPLQLGFSLMLVVLTGCPGSKIAITDPGHLSLFSCAPGASKAVPNPLQRLSKLQFGNTLRDLLATRFSDSNEVAAAMDAVSPQLSLYPPDLDNDFDRLDTRVGQDHVNAAYAVAVHLANWVNSDRARLGRFTKNCATNANPASCVESFIRDFGLYAYRRPLSSEEVSELKSSFQSQGSDGFRYIIGRILASPYFMYRVEDQGSPDSSDPSALRLTAYELASRLSYQLWDSMPDAELFQAAASGKILDETFYKNLVESYFAGGPKTERVKPTFRRFFSQWFALDQVPQIDVGRSPAFAAFASGVDVHAQNVNVRNDMINEVLDLTDYYTWQEQGTLADIYLTKANFAKTDILAQIYGSSKWTPGEKPIEMGDSERAGVLTRAALMASGSEVTRPIHRGAFIRQRILCDKVMTPEDVGVDPALTKPPEMDPTKNSRQRFTEKTSPALCMGCHAQLNPLGFAMESLDSLGRPRGDEKVFGEDGDLLGTPRIDAVVDPGIESLNGGPSVSGPAELSAAIAHSEKAQSCFARYYFRYLYRRVESAATDGCALSGIRSAMHGDPTTPGSLKKVFMQAVLDPSFKLRAMPN